MISPSGFSYPKGYKNISACTLQGLHLCLVGCWCLDLRFPSRTLPCNESSTNPLSVVPLCSWLVCEQVIVCNSLPKFRKRWAHGLFGRLCILWHSLVVMQHEWCENYYSHCSKYMTNFMTAAWLLLHIYTPVVLGKSVADHAVGVECKTTKKISLFRLPCQTKYQCINFRRGKTAIALIKRSILSRTWTME